MFVRLRIQHGVCIMMRTDLGGRCWEWGLSLSLGGNQTLAISMLQSLSLYGNKALSSKIDFSEMHVLHLNAQNSWFPFKSLSILGIDEILNLALCLIRYPVCLICTLFNSDKYLFLTLGETYFICWITLPSDLKKIEIWKKKIDLETNWW